MKLSIEKDGYFFKYGENRPEKQGKHHKTYRFRFHEETHEKERGKVQMVCQRLDVLQEKSLPDSESG
jgi:hypothetical protein